MDEIRKMALVPANYMSHLLQPPGTLNPSPQLSVGRQLSKLDSEMKRILDDVTVPDDVKYKLYSHALSQFTELREETKKPIKMQIESEKDAQKQLSAESLLSHAGDIPADKKDVARKLAAFLERCDNIKWSDKGVLIIDGTEVQGSNVHDLFDYVTRNRSTTAPPIGFRRFCDKLDEANAPMSIIGNKNLKKAQQWIHVQQQGQGYKQRPRKKVVKKPPRKPKRLKKPVIHFESLYK